MERINNIPEKFFREIRVVEIYEAKNVLYKDVFFGDFPNPKDALYIIDVIPEEFSQKIATKKANGNYYTDYDISFPLLDLSKETVEKFEKAFNKQEFVIVLVSNVEKMIAGSKMEKFKVEFIDNKKNNNSGNDEYTISITGQSILKPKIKKI